MDRLKWLRCVLSVHRVAAIMLLVIDDRHHAFSFKLKPVSARNFKTQAVVMMMKGKSESRQNCQPKLRDGEKQWYMYQNLVFRDFCFGIKTWNE